MQTTMAVEGLQMTLPQLLDHLTPGDEVVFTRNHQMVATLISQPTKKRQPRKAGNCIGMIKVVADDDEHLKDFGEYM